MKKLKLLCVLLFISGLNIINNKNICLANSNLISIAENVQTKQVITSIEPLVHENLDSNSSELELLALIIYQEHGGNESSDSSRLMAGNVVLNRVKSLDFPNNIYDVITDEGQYGQETGPEWPKRAFKSEEYEAIIRAFNCAQKILDGELILPENVVWQANFKQGKGIYAYQDKTYFCY